MSHDGYFLVAHCVNATSLERAEVEWEVASQGLDGEWYTNDGRNIIPFHTQPINDPFPSIPEGWIDHLSELARHYAANHKTPQVSLVDMLGLVKPKTPAIPIKRRF